MRALYPTGDAALGAAERFLADRSLGLESPDILRISGQVRALKAEGAEVFDLTLGDFDPEHFPPPASLLAAIRRHLEAGRTNYPPADGVPALRSAVADYYERQLGVRFPVESVLVGSGARPLLYSVYASTLTPGDALIYAAPSWNNEHYAYLNGVESIVLQCGRETGFMPTLAQIEPHLERARVLHINNPLNPTGTVMSSAELTAISGAVVEENARRDARGRKALVMVYDMVYWPLVYGETEFRHPVQLVPEVAPHVVSIDAISKWMASTGIRVGWAIVPPFAHAKIKALGSHAGAWAPHAEQHAVAEVLSGDSGFGDYVSDLKAGLEERLDVVSAALDELARNRTGVEAIRPQGAIYLSIRLDLVGGKTPQGKILEDSEQVREYLLHEGRVGLIPFSAFGSTDRDGWYRVSVAAMSTDRLREAMVALASAVEAVAG